MRVYPEWLETEKRGDWALLLINRVAVEKLSHRKFAKIASRQEALQTNFPSRLDIFHQPIFPFFQIN
jgi:hypothetical protein